MLIACGLRPWGHFVWIGLILDQIVIVGTVVVVVVAVE